MGRRRKTEFDESLMMNNFTWRQYYKRLMELSMVMFDWQRLPDTIDPRYLEKTLFNRGASIWFEDDIIGFLALQSANYGRLDVYDVPDSRRAYASNGYQRDLTKDNSIIIYNNYLRTPSRLDVEMFAKRLYNIDRAIDVNVNAQKTPILLLCDENERLSYLNMYKEYDGNAPVIKGSNGIDLNGFTVLKTDAPYVADKLYQLKTDIWNEALTYLGIANVSFQKKERMITDEISSAMGGTFASRYSRLLMRQQACEKINDMFGLDIWVEYRDFEDLPELADGGEDNE